MAIVAILTVAVVAAVVLWVLLPGWVVNPSDYVIAADQPNAGALDPAAASNARLAARAPTGVLAGAIVAAAAAGTGLIVSNHNARLTRETNDLTRRRDENALAHNNRLVEREQDRADDDRFTTAIGQLGNTAASVRLGGLHSLHRLAQQRPGRLTTILDILSAYLRQPFHHPDHDEKPPAEQDDPTGEPSPKAWWPKDAAERDERDAEAEVRRTALRLLTDLLPAADSVTPGPDINFQAAALVGDWILTGKKLGSVDLTGTHLSGTLWLGEGTNVGSDLVLGEGASISGRLVLNRGVSIGGYLVLSKGASIGGRLLLNWGASISGTLWLRSGSKIGGDLKLEKGASIGGDLELDDDVSIGGDLWVGIGASIGGDLKLENGVSITDDLRLEEGASIGGRVALGFNTSIGGELCLEEGASIGGGLDLERGASIGRNFALEKDASIGGRVALGSDASIGGLLWLERGASIGGGLVLWGGASINGVDEQFLSDLAVPGLPALQGPVQVPAEPGGKAVPSAESIASTDVD